MTSAIVSFAQRITPDASAPAADRLLAGNPKQSISNHFTDPSQQFFAGRWTSTRGKWRVKYTENEFCHITAGQVRIASNTGQVETFGPGDTFVIPAGFEGTWEVLEDCSKLYAIFEPTHRGGAGA
ncbi:MAG: cupin domain-containing protein [Steroidobacteraceae bacterium]